MTSRTPLSEHLSDKYTAVIIVAALLTMTAIALRYRIVDALGGCVGAFRAQAKHCPSHDPLLGVGGCPSVRDVEGIVAGVKQCPADHEQIKEAYEKRASYLADRSRTIALNVKAVLLFSLLGFIGLRGRDPEIALPGTPFKIPRGLAFLVLPAAILYLWLQFGFALNAAIESRLALQVWIQDLEGHSPWGHSHSLVSTLEDQGLLDVWFVANEGYLAAARMPHAVVAFIHVVESIFGALYGASHAVMFLMFNRLVDHHAEGREKYAALALAYFAVLVVLAAQLMFGVGAGHPNYFQYASLSTLAAALALRELLVRRARRA